MRNVNDKCFFVFFLFFFKSSPLLIAAVARIACRVVITRVANAFRNRNACVYLYFFFIVAVRSLLDLHTLDGARQKKRERWSFLIMLRVHSPKFIITLNDRDETTAIQGLELPFSAQQLHRI